MYKCSLVISDTQRSEASCWKLDRGSSFLKGEQPTNKWHWWHFVLALINTAECASGEHSPALLEWLLVLLHCRRRSWPAVTVLDLMQLQEGLFHDCFCTLKPGHTVKHIALAVLFNCFWNISQMFLNELISYFLVPLITAGRNTLILNAGLYCRSIVSQRGRLFSDWIS